MRKLAGLFLVAIFLCLSSLHVYWAAGGRWGSNAAVPTVDATPLFVPSRFATLVVAAALFAASFVVAGAMGWLGDAVPARICRRLTLGIALLFLLRAIGDFRYVGLFATATPSAFAYLDLRLYSPLCLALAAAGFFVGWSKS